MPSSDLPVANTDALPQVSVDNCLLKVLMWNPSWLQEYGMSYFCVCCIYLLNFILFRLEICSGNSETGSMVGIVC